MGLTWEKYGDKAYSVLDVLVQYIYILFPHNLTYFYGARTKVLSYLLISWNCTGAAHRHKYVLTVAE